MERAQYDEGKLTLPISDADIPKKAVLLPITLCDPASSVQDLYRHIRQYVGDSDCELTDCVELVTEQIGRRRKKVFAAIEGRYLGQLKEEDAEYVSGLIENRRIVRVHHIEVGKDTMAKTQNLMCVLMLVVADRQEDAGNIESRAAYVCGRGQSAPAAVFIKSESGNPAGSTKFNLKIAGVTYANDDGSSRQEYLEKICAREPPFEDPGKYEVFLQGYMFQGQSAILVSVNGCCIGNIAKSDVQRVSAALVNRRIRSVKSVSVEDFINDDGEQIFYCKLILNVDGEDLERYPETVIQTRTVAPVAVPAYRDRPSRTGDDVARCPYCGSTSVVPGRKRWNHLLAILGFLFLAGVGVLLGFVGKGGYRRCLRCNKRW